MVYGIYGTWYYGTHYVRILDDCSIPNFNDSDINQITLTIRKFGGILARVISVTSYR